MDGKTYHAHVQEIKEDKGPATVFIEETGSKYVYFHIHLAEPNKN